MENDTYLRKKLINRFSYLSLFLGILSILFMAYLIFYRDFKGDDLSNFYIVIGILFLFGFLGNEFVDIFKNTIRSKIEEKVNKYLEDNKHLIELASETILVNYKVNFAKTIEESLNDFKQDLQEKNEGNSIVLGFDNIDENANDDITNLTVIVASGGSFDWNLANKAYFHPKIRSFREGVKYLGFYNKGKIKGYGVIEKIEDDNKLKELVKSANEKGYEVNTKEHDFFSCAKDFKVTNIDWSSLGRSPVMSKQYISLDELKQNK